MGRIVPNSVRRGVGVVILFPKVRLCEIFHFLNLRQPSLPPQLPISPIRPMDQVNHPQASVPPSFWKNSGIFEKIGAKRVC